MSYFMVKITVCTYPKLRVRDMTPYCHVGSGYFIQLCLLHKGLPWPWPKVISPRSGSYPIFMSGSLLLSVMLDWIFHTIVVFCPSVCHDLDPRSCFQDHSINITKIFLWLINHMFDLDISHNWPFAKDRTLYLLADFFILTSQSNGPSNCCRIVMTQWNDLKMSTWTATCHEFGKRSIVSWPWLRVILPRSRSQFIQFLGHNRSRVTWMWIALNNCYPWPWGCCFRGIYPLRTCLIHVSSLQGFTKLLWVWPWTLTSACFKCNRCCHFLL